jgi:tellurium resistance protein TerD
MAISLVKGQKIDLTKTNAGLSKLVVGLGWDPAEVSVKKGFFGGKKKEKADIDCDASALLLNEEGKLTNANNLVCFYNKKSLTGAVTHSGDNMTGDGDGDDEQIFVDLNEVPADVHKILMVVNIYECERRGQDFGMVESAFIRVVNAADQQELVRFNLTENYAGKTALVVGEIYRHNGDWKFSAIGEGMHASHIDHLAAKYK